MISLIVTFSLKKMTTLVDKGLMVVLHPTTNQLVSQA